MSFLKRKTPLRRSKITFMKRKPIRKVSKKKAAKDRVYTKLRREFLDKEENRFCPVMLAIENKLALTDQIHHRFGRVAELYLDQDTWMAVSLEGHQWIHNNPLEAKMRGWLGKKYTESFKMHSDNFGK